jgi:hypothetical protein
LRSAFIALWGSLCGHIYAVAIAIVSEPDTFSTATAVRPLAYNISWARITVLSAIYAAVATLALLVSHALLGSVAARLSVTRTLVIIFANFAAGWYALTLVTALPLLTRFTVVAVATGG